jgi:hypothetical protein
MVDSEHRTGHALELAGSATLATARPRIALAAVAKPAAEVAGLLLVEVLGNPRGAGGRTRPGAIPGALVRQSAPTCLGWRRDDHPAGHGGAGR